MKFFVTGSGDEADAEHLWATARVHLFELGLPTTRRRIHALSLRPDCPQRVEVSGDTPDGETVLIILEASDADLFYVCTPGRGVLGGVPFVLGLDEDGNAIDFDPEVVGWA